MVNYKRVVCEVVLVLGLVAAAAAAPADCDKKADNHYDQRQNGTENYRLNIDGVVIAIAPAESLINAVSELDFASDLFDQIQDYDALKPPSDLKPQESKPPSKPEDKPDGEKPSATPLSDVSLSSDGLKGQKKEAGNRKQEKAHRLKMRLASMLLPLLKKNRHH